MNEIYLYIVSLSHDDVYHIKTYLTYRKLC